MTDKDEPEIKFPSPLVFKGDNGEYLRLITDDKSKSEEKDLLKFNGKKYDRECQFEVISLNGFMDGYVLIESLHNRKLWSGNPGPWIKANVVDGFDHHTLFKPVLLADKRVAFIHNETKKYCKRLTSNDRQSMLSASTANIDEFCMLSVEEPVLRRTINHVMYDKDNKELIKLDPLVFVEKVITNDTEYKADFAVAFTHTYTKTKSFMRSATLAAGVETTIEAGIPFLASGNIKVSGSISAALEWGKSDQELSTVTGTITIKDITPGKKVKVIISGERATVNIPFSYQQIDYMSDGGQVKITKMSDGVFSLMNEYYARYEALKL